MARADMRRILMTLQLVCWLFVLAACTTKELEEGDRDLVLKIGQLEPYGLGLPRDYSSFESFKRQQWIDGTFSVEYEFQAPGQLQLPYLYSITEKHSSKGDACKAYAAGNFGVPIGLGDIELSVQNDLFQFGDKSRFALLMIEDEPVGNYFAMCHGKTSLMLILTGFYFDDGEMWAELISSTLNAVGS